MASALDLIAGSENDEDIFVDEMMSSLCRKGYCVSQMSRSESTVSEMLKAAEDLSFSRVPADFESYYLGKESREKTILLDFEGGDVPEAVMDSPLAFEDSQMSSLCGLLGPCLEDELGVRIATRTNLLVRQTFSGLDEESAFIAPAEPSGKEQEQFMGLMKRKRVCVMQFVGPLTSSLKLMPKDGGEDVEITGTPGTMVVFLTEQFGYSHVCEGGATMVLQCWFLAKAPQMEMLDIGGDMDVLSQTETGAALPGREPVAITGIGVMMGGDSKDHQCMWLAVNKGGADASSKFPITRFDASVYCDIDDMNRAMTSGKSYTQHQGWVDGIEYFDSALFGISNAEARAMDPNQRKCMETVYSCMHVAGHSMQTMKQKAQHIGCFVGVSGSEWNFVPHDTDTAGCGGAEAIIANRLNFVMNLKGPSVTSNTACSAGLTAINIGKLWVKYKDFDPLDASVGGGVQLAYSPVGFIGCCGGGMLSYKGRCWTFDTGGDGYLRGEGSTMVCMQLLEYTDEVFAMFIGGQSNQDGRSASITAPNGPSQEKCIKAALREASVGAIEVDCFECHGTGTALGDPIEVGAFKRIYAAAGRNHSLMVCTSKTNYGHSEGGAGSCGFTKCIQQVMRCEASPGLHLRELNAHLDVAGFPAQMITESMACKYQSSMCGVSSFGFGGTNGHCMAYGQNRTTSRQVANLVDFRRVMLNKIENAPPPQIMMPSFDPEEWETNGMPVGEVSAPKIYQVELLASGKTIWREIEPEPPSRFGIGFKLSGSFNFWDLAPMQEDIAMPDLFTAELTIGDQGYECFYIVCEEDQNMVYYPDVSKGASKSSLVLGPSEPPVDREGNSWGIEDAPGTKYSIEFYRTDFLRTISWTRLP